MAKSALVTASQWWSVTYGPTSRGKAGCQTGTTSRPGATTAARRDEHHDTGCQIQCEEEQLTMRRNRTTSNKELLHEGLQVLIGGPPLTGESISLS
jgi:hypothetical protein